MININPFDHKLNEIAESSIMEGHQSTVRIIDVGPTWMSLEQLIEPTSTAKPQED